MAGFAANGQADEIGPWRCSEHDERSIKSTLGGQRVKMYYQFYTFNILSLDMVYVSKKAL